MRIRRFKIIDYACRSFLKLFLDSGSLPDISTKEIARAEFQKKVYEIQTNGFSSSLTGYFLSGLKQSFSSEYLCELFLIASTEAIFNKERLAKESEKNKNKVLDFDMNGLPTISDIWR